MLPKSNNALLNGFTKILQKIILISTHLRNVTTTHKRITNPHFWWQSFTQTTVTVRRSRLIVLILSSKGVISLPRGRWFHLGLHPLPNMKHEPHQHQQLPSRLTFCVTGYLVWGGHCMHILRFWLARHINFSSKKSYHYRRSNLLAWPHIPPIRRRFNTL